MDSAWAERRKARIRMVVLVATVSLFALYLAVSLYRPATCFDGTQNQDEVGLDCGGSCDLVCDSQAQDLRTAWVRPFKVSKGWYSALAYVENTNVDVHADRVPYRFQFYDKEGLLITERTGSSFITRDPITPIFVGRVDVGEHEVYRATFEWLEKPVWYRDTHQYRVSFEEQEFVSRRLGQDLVVVAHNLESIPLTNIRVVAILYDAQENAIGASETYIEQLGPREKRTITFSWADRFGTSPARVELLSRIPLQP
jgi:hypothetical protein